MLTNTLHRCFVGIVVIALQGLSTAFPDTLTMFRTYTTLAGYYDIQSTFRTPQYIRVNSANGNIHVIMMVSDDSLDPGGPQRERLPPAVARTLA